MDRGGHSGGRQLKSFSPTCATDLLHLSPSRR